MELDTPFAKAATVTSKRMLSNKKLTVHTKLHVYQVYLIGTVLYGSEAWTPYVRKQKRLSSFHLPAPQPGHHVAALGTKHIND